MFGLFFNKQKVINEAQAEVYAKWEKERKERWESVKKAQEAELEMHLGNLVICLPNEIENLTVGYGKEIQYITQDKSPVLIVHDIVRNEDVMILGLVFAYTDQKFNALNKLDANERIAIYYSRLGDEDLDKSATKNEDPMPAEEWAEKVRNAIAEWKNEQKS